MSLFVICCGLSFFACCLLSVVRGFSFDVCYSLWSFVVRRCLLFAVCCLSFVVYQLLDVVCSLCVVCWLFVVCR